MRVISCFAAALILSIATPVFAQDDWDNFVSVGDGFEVNLPGKPEITNIIWTTQFRYTLPGHVYTASHGQERYTVTVVDYTDVERQGVERSMHCPIGAETCQGTQDGHHGAIMGLGYWKMDVRGAIAFAALKFMQRDAKITDFNLEFEQVVEGYLMQMTNRDESRTFAYITMHENKLYIFEGTTPKGHPQAMLFQSSVGFVDAKGGSIRYQDYYANEVHGLRQYEPPPFRVNGGPEQTYPIQTPSGPGRADRTPPTGGQ
jgi:hypothetical protein